MDARRPIVPFPFHRMNNRMNKGPPVNMINHPQYGLDSHGPQNLEIKSKRMAVSWRDDTLFYVPDRTGKQGVCILEPSMQPGQEYFEAEIVSTGRWGAIRIGLAPPDHSLEVHLGIEGNSVAFSVDDSAVYGQDQTVTLQCRACKPGDKIGVGIKFGENYMEGADEKCPVVFTLNGKEIHRRDVVIPFKGLCPAVSMASQGQMVRFKARCDWSSQEEEMVIDSCEDDWARLHDVTVHGQILAYAGRGKTIADVGLAQAKKPLSPTNHYFELEIIDPGKNCYIAIGLAKKDYPKKRHPGWNYGSIAYHADDGKIFKGSGVGDSFGPRCHKGDIMGCGIMFPRDYIMDSDEGESDNEEVNSVVKAWPDREPFNRLNQLDRIAQDNFAIDVYDLSEDEYDDYLSEEEEYELQIDGVQQGGKVQVHVFFTRNGTTIGRREVHIPASGFYPTIGMLSLDEKVRVDLRPLSG
ncbi:SPRY domain-containing protein 3-like [Patiria miniata]|uniref:B30.2/SPRY domain-containing protein n=1 Tax=Patiria miniata TaxID=46514 RepID=A0A913ZNK5_PATMI|nr:SPRY domain-containing protein 3-like [Patiria miniata]